MMGSFPEKLQWILTTPESTTPRRGLLIESPLAYLYVLALAPRYDAGHPKPEGESVVGPVA